MGTLVEMLGALVPEQTGAWCSGVTLDGKRLPHVGRDSRDVYALPGVPYVLKCLAYGRDSMGTSVVQPVNEWTMWHRELHCSPVRELVAPCSFLVMLPLDGALVLVGDVQERVMDGGKATAKERALHNGYEEACAPVRACHEIIQDLAATQCVFDANKGHYVLVDYGGAWQVEQPRGVRAAHDLVRTTEKALVVGGLDELARLESS
jgi:hypothetical protein